MKTNNFLFNPICLVFIVILIFYSCSSNPKIPVWEITKDGNPTSYLVASSSYLSKNDIDKMLSNKIILLFDSCETYISLWNLEQSNLVETKQWIEIGNSKTIKDTLTKETFNLLKTKVEEINNKSEFSFESPDSIRIKPQFYINDILNKNDNNHFNIDQFFFKRAMPQNKNITGLVSLQEFYKAYNAIQYEDYINQLNSIVSLFDEKVMIEVKGNELYKDENYAELKNIQSTLILNPKTIITEDWFNKIDLETAKQSSFILLDIKYINPDNEEALYKGLLLKGYKLTRIN
jgi:uncharacterized protein YbaP (TraB family)